jgi:hypothetical protein
MEVILVASPAPMPVIAKFSGERSHGFLNNVAVRTGIYAGFSLGLVFTAWILIDNHASFLDRFVMELNIAAAALILLFACIPLMRFYRSPAELLISGLLAWGILTLTYRILGFLYVPLEEYYGTFQVFVLGAVSYLIFATLSWIGTIIWRVRRMNSFHTHH